MTKKELKIDRNCTKVIKGLKFGKEETLSDKREVWEEDEKLRKVVYLEEDLRFHIKRLMENVDKNKLLEADFQSGEIEFSLTRELIPIEVLQRLMDEEFGDKLTK